MCLNKFHVSVTFVYIVFYVIIWVFMRLWAKPARKQQKKHVVGELDLEDENDERWIKSVISSAEPGCFSGLKIVLDCANGATVNKASVIFQELGATVVEVGSNPDGRNINDNCGSNNPENLREEKIYIQGATYNKDSIDIAISQVRFRSYPRYKRST